MSEPSSLYVRAHLSKDAYERFLKSQRVGPKAFDDWMVWLANVELASGQPTPALIDEVALALADDTGTVEEGIEGWCDSDWSFAKSVYDEKTGLWQFGVLQFSENIYEYLAYLPFVRAVSMFQDRTQGDFMLVFPFIWAPDTCELCIDLDPGASRLHTEASPQRMAEARTFLSFLMPADTD